MKKLVSVILSIMLLASILTGCSGDPMKAYKEEVKAAGIEDTYAEIQTKAQELNDYLDTFFDEVQVTFQDISQMSEYSEAVNKLDELKELVDNAIAKAEGFKTDNEQVKKANDYLLAALSEYKDFCDMIDKVFNLAIQIAAIMNNTMSSQEQLASLGVPSTEVAMALTEILNEYADVLNNASAYQEIFGSEEMNIEAANEMMANIQEVVDKVKSIPTSNEKDEQYVQLFADAYSGTIEMFKLIIENKEIAGILGSYEDNSDFLKDKSEETSKNIDSWKEAMN